MCVMFVEYNEACNVFIQGGSSKVWDLGPPGPGGELHAKGKRN